MTIPIDLNDAWHRFEWADFEAQRFDAWSKAFVELGPYMTHIQRDGDRRWNWRFLRLIDEGDEAEHLREGSRYLGTFLDHMRAALNYLAYQIALLDNRERPRLPKPQAVRATTIEFPIFPSLSLFRHAKGSAAEVRKLPDKYRLPLEAKQPENGRYPGLLMLHELAREYRHRVIHPVALYPMGPDGGFNGAFPATSYNVEWRYAGGPLKAGDVLVTFETAIDFDPDDYPALVLGIGIDHPVTKGVSAIHVLGEIARDVHGVLREWWGLPWPPVPSTAPFPPGFGAPISGVPAKGT